MQVSGTIGSLQALIATTLVAHTRGAHVFGVIDRGEAA